MAKEKTLFTCTECGGTSPRWLGKCPSCNAWNTLIESVAEAGPGKNRYSGAQFAGLAQAQAVMPLAAIEATDIARTPSGIDELDRVLGGGIVEGGVVLIGGDPGIGKSTLLLQALDALQRAGLPTLYVTGEESGAQVALRSRRLGLDHSQVNVLAEIQLEKILATIESMQPAVAVIDSIQTVYSDQLTSAPGSVAQVRECAAHLTRCAKASGVAIVLVGHVTKEGALAGPRVLEHMVDTVLYFEGERNYAFRVLRPIKNRFGTIAESGIFSMERQGLVEVKNPSQFFLAERGENTSGSAITACLEGIRPLLIEIQALVSTTCFGLPRRTTAGVDANRLALLLAVMEKRQGMMLGNQDVYVNAVGGFRLSEPAADLAVALAVASSFRNRAIDRSIVAIGEVGLTGEIRMVPRAVQRLREAVNLGFCKVIVPWGNLAELKKEAVDVELIGAKNLSQAMEVGLQ